MGGLASLLVGLNNGESSWNSVGTIAPLVIGGVSLAAGAVNEAYTKQSPIIPPRLFRTRTTSAILAITFLHGTAFFMGSYFVPLYFQVLGSNALLAGVRGLPYSLMTSFTAVIGGFIVSKVYRNFRVIISCGLAIMTLGVSSIPPVRRVSRPQADVYHH